MTGRILIIGNGPSLRSLDHQRLQSVATLGLDAGLLRWQQIDWYPDHYCCIDPSLIEQHWSRIKRLIDEQRLQTAFLSARFLDFHPAAKDDARYLFLEQVSNQHYQTPCSEYGLSHSATPIFDTHQDAPPNAVDTAVRYAVQLGYQQVGLLGLAPADITAVGQHTEAADDPPERQFDPTPLIALRDALVLQDFDISVVACDRKSALHRDGLFPYQELPLFLREPRLSALVITSQASELDRLLACMALWDQPAFCPFLHFIGRQPPRLIFSFTGARDTELQSRLTEQFAAGKLLARSFSSIECRFYQLAEDEDVYIRDYSKDPGPKGYKSGPNQQFFHTIADLHGLGGHAYFMESDCVPIRPDWLGYLSEQLRVADPPWILGSAYRGDSTLTWRHSRHINGSALYAIGDRAFQHFAQQWRQLTADAVQHDDPRLAYDCVLEHILYREVDPATNPYAVMGPDSSGWRLFQETASRLHFTDFTQNLSANADQAGADDRMVDRLRRDYPGTYVVHNRRLTDHLIEKHTGIRLPQPEPTPIDQQSPVVDAPPLLAAIRPDYLLGQSQYHPRSGDISVAASHVENYAAFIRPCVIKPGDRVVAEFTLRGPKDRTLAVGLHRHGETPYEGIRESIHCSGEEQQVTLTLAFEHNHHAARLQIGSGDHSPQKFILRRVEFHVAEPEVPPVGPAPDNP